MKNRIIILSIFIFLISLLITLNVIFHESLQNELTAQYNKQQLLIARTIAGSIFNAIDHLREESTALAQLLAARGIDKEEGLEEFITTAFEEVTIEMDTTLTVLDKKGKPVFATIKDIPLTEDDRRLFEISKKLEKGKIYFLEKVKKDDKRLKMTTPIRKDKKLLGSILLSINVDAINKEFLSPIKSGQRGYAWMIDSSGTLIYHPTQPDMIGNNLYTANKECFRCHHSFELEKKVLEGPIEYGRYIAPTGEDKVLAFSRVYFGNISWIVCVSSPYSEVISITARSMKLYSGLVVAIFATVFLGASVMVLINRQRVKTEIESKEAILLEKQKLDTIVSAIGSGLMLLNNEHNILWINKTLREWAGDVEGQNCNVIYPISSPKAGYRDITHEIYKGLFGKKGSVFQITSVPVKDKEGKIIGALKLIQDVTEIKRLEESILRSEKLAALGRLAAGISHEIGNPLTSISSFVQILKEKADDDFTKENLETIHHHIMRISEIVGQMSRLAKLPQMELQQCDINHIIESSMEIIKYDKKLKNIKIMKEFANSLPLVYVDEDYLSQVFINLILNAADAIQDEKGAITVRSLMDNNSVIVQFIDTGIGMPTECLSRIFDPFFTTKEKGTGLGLSISYEIVKRLGGELRVESQVNIGSIFSVILPVRGFE